MSMDGNRNIDQFVQKKLAKRNYEFQDAYWHAAEKLIVADEQRRKRRWWFFMALGLILLLGGGSSYWGIRNWDLKALNISPNNIETPERFTNTTHPQKNFTNIIAESEKVNTSYEVSKKNRGKSSLDHSVNHSDNPLNQQLNQTIVISQGYDLVKKARKNEDFEERIAGITSVDDAGELIIRPSLLVSPRSVPLISIKNQTGLDKTIITLNTIETIITQLLNPLSIREEMDLVKEKKRHNAWYVIGGGQLSRGTLGQDGRRSGFGADPLLGISYERQLGRRISIHSDLRYQPRSGLNSAQTSTSTLYDFGIEQITTRLTAKRIHYLSLPIYLKIKVGKRHYTTLGVNYAYIFQVSGEKVSLHQNSLNGLSQTKESIWGLRQNFQQNDIALQLGYEYHLNNGLFIGLQANYGLKNLYKKEVGIMERNTQVQFYLRYRLFDRLYIK